MKVTFQYGTTILLLLFSYNVLAQDFELIKIQSAYYPKQTINESAVDGEIGFWEWNGQLAIPQLLKNEKTVLIHKLGYSNLRVDIEGSTANASAEATNYYHTISYTFTLVQTLSPTWRLLLNANPTLASDFTESLNDEDLLFQASAIAMKTKSRKFKYGFGLAYTTRFGRQLVIPTGMVQYKTEKMVLDMLLPNKLSVMFNTHQAVNFGLEAKLDGGLFNNNSEIQNVSTIIDKAGYSRLNIGPAITFKLQDAIRVHLTGGMAVGRRLEFVDVAEETLDRTPENGPFFKVGLSFSPQAKNAGATLNN
ncbi:MAG: DUF6268 family outer membrane beta-barrel protein [Bacteroidota bacterium]